MTDSQLSGGKFKNGGNQTHWSSGGDMISHRQNQGSSVFLPAVLTPSPDTPKVAAIELSSKG